MIGTKIVMASPASRLAAKLSGASPRTPLPARVPQKKFPKEVPNDREREDKCVYRSVAAFWPSVFTFFMEGFAAYGAMMHGISVDAVLTATRCSSWWSGGSTTFEAAHEHGLHLKSEHYNVVELDRVATTAVGRVAKIG